MVNQGPNATPNHIQDPASVYPLGVNSETYTVNSFKAWCAPTSAACQLGHLNLQTPAEIYDGYDANEKPIAQSTIAWDTGRGWADYLLDGPNNRLQISNNTSSGFPTDIAFYMNTNNVGVDGVAANSAVGTKLGNIYSGLNKFYSDFGYANMVGSLYVNSGQAPFSDGILAEYYSNNSIAADFGPNSDPGNVFNTIKHEIDNNRSVLASFRHWALNQLQVVTLAQPVNTEINLTYYELSPSVANNVLTGENYFYDNDAHTNSLGHTVNIIGYILADTTDDIQGGTNWLVIRDNQENTARNVVLNYTSSFSALIGLTFVNPSITTYQAPNPPQTFNIVVSAFGSTSYQLDGEDRTGPINGEDPNLNINLGDTLTMQINSSSHPLWIKTSQVIGIGNAVPEVINNGTANGGIINWTPTATGEFFYICQFHGGMTGKIRVN